MKINQLLTETIFRYNGVTYKLQSTQWSVKGAKSTNTPVLGENIENDDLIVECIPKMGGVFQRKIKKWIAGNTNVSVNYD
jgi:hypothetical protein